MNVNSISSSIPTQRPAEPAPKPWDRAERRRDSFAVQLSSILQRSRPEKAEPPKAEKTKKVYADLNGDAKVDGADLGLLLGKFGSNDAQADLDKNGIVDASDLKLLYKAFERTV